MFDTLQQRSNSRTRCLSLPSFFTPNNWCRRWFFHFQFQCQKADGKLYLLIHYEPELYSNFILKFSAFLSLDILINFILIKRKECRDLFEISLAMQCYYLKFPANDVIDVKYTHYLHSVSHLSVPNCMGLTSNPMAARVISDKFPSSFYKIKFPSLRSGNLVIL